MPNNSPTRAQRPQFTTQVINGVRTLVVTNHPANAGIVLPKITFDASFNKYNDIVNALETLFYHDTGASRVGLALDLENYASRGWDLKIRFEDPNKKNSGGAFWRRLTLDIPGIGLPTIQTPLILTSPNTSEGILAFQRSMFQGDSDSVLSNVLRMLSHEGNSPYEHTNFVNGIYNTAARGHPTGLMPT